MTNLYDINKINKALEDWIADHSSKLKLSEMPLIMDGTGKFFALEKLTLKQWHEILKKIDITDFEKTYEEVKD